MKILNYNFFVTSQRSNESLYYEQTSWSKYIDGEEVTITIQQVQRYLDDKKIPTIEIVVDEIYDMCCHAGKTDKQTLERSESSDLSYPIIISKGLDGNWSMILDGHHRLFKAHKHNISKIKARVIDLKEAPRIYQNLFGR